MKSPLRFACVLVTAFTLMPMAVAATPAPAPQTTSLWKVVSPQRTLYVIGTTQLLTKLDYPLPKPITAAFARSQALLLEGDPGADSKAIAAFLKEKGTLPAGETLMGQLSVAQQKTLEQALAAANVPLAKVNHLQPWLAALQLTRAALAQLGITPEQGETQYFYDRAKKRGIPIQFLETASEQIRFFSGLPERLQVEWLMLQARGLSNTIETREKIVTAWNNGDIAVLVKLIHGNLDGKPELYEALVSKRNDAWEKALEARLARSGAPIFVLVGMGNLIGAGGLLARLRADGYTVTQL